MLIDNWNVMSRKAKGVLGLINNVHIELPCPLSIVERDAITRFPTSFPSAQYQDILSRPSRHSLS